MYSALQIAEYIVIRANREGLYISCLTLGKLLYFVQARFLVRKGEPCFGDAIEAWSFGPVVPDVYRKYIAYGSAWIPFCSSAGEGRYRKPDKEDQKLIDSVMDRYCRYSASSLTELTKKQEPWIRAYRGNHQKPGVITKKSIREYYAKFSAKYSALQIAEYIVMRADRKGMSVSTLSLGKLLYFIQAQFLVSQGKPCFDDVIEARDFGPAVPAVYSRYEIYGNWRIPAPSRARYKMPDEEDRKLIDGIMDAGCRYSNRDLTEFTRNQMPWRRAYQRSRDQMPGIIMEEDLEEFFS